MKSLSLLLLLAALSFLSLQKTEAPKARVSCQWSLYLTSDDGPLVGSGNLERVVRDLKVPLSVFLVGIPMYRDSGLAKYLELYKHNPWIELGNHSFTHANFRYRSYYSMPRKVLEDFEKNAEFLKLSRKIARLPGRNIWRLNKRTKGKGSGTEAADLLAKRGYRIFGWDLEWRHDRRGYPLQNAYEIRRRIVNALRKKRTFIPGHLILLMHDEMFLHPAGARHLKKLIEILRADPRCRIETLRKYPD